MDTDKLRRYAQIFLAAVAVLAAVGAGFRYLVRGGSPFGAHVVASPTAGPIGMRPYFDFPGFPGGREVTVYLCAGAVTGVEDCANLGKGKTGERLRAKAIPKELPDTTEVVPGDYVLRAGPDDAGDFPDRGTFKVVPFKIGAKPRPLSFNGLGASDLRIGEPRNVAKGAACRAPLFLADGRLVVG
jgi:hypothetical protein